MALWVVVHFGGGGKQVGVVELLTMAMGAKEPGGGGGGRGGAEATAAAAAAAAMLLQWRSAAEMISVVCTRLTDTRHGLKLSEGRGENDANNCQSTTITEVLCYFSCFIFKSFPNIFWG